MKKKKIVFSFGRFNPPTTGHLLLASKVKKEAMRRGADHIIFGSSSQDRKKNPLSPRDKLRFMKKVLKGFNVMVDSSIASPFHALDYINKQGYTDVVFVVGGDRVPEFRKQMKKYVGPKKMYKFQNFEVISAGERDPDADDVTGMSASKMRAAAAKGNLDAFQLGIPSGVSTNDVAMLFKKIQKGMGVKPFVAESWFNLDEFNEFLSEQNLKDFDLSGEGIDIPAINNAVWGTKGLKKKKKKKVTKVTEEKIFEISMQSRRKMARNAKRTAKRRARKRKIKEKRKKSEGAIKNKAQKSAIAKVRAKLIKGVNWNDLSFSQRSKVEEKLKKKKKVIARLSKRLLPSARADEKARLKKVRERMTTNDPAKAVEKFESIDYDFETEVLTEVLNESRLLSFSEASQVAAMKQKIGAGEQGSGYYSKDGDKEAKKEQPESKQEIFYIVKNKKTNKTQVVVKFNKDDHSPMDQGAKSSIVGSAKKASGEEDFDWRSSKSAMAKLGITKAVDAGERGTSKEGGTTRTQPAKKGEKKLKKVEQPATGAQPEESPPLSPDNHEAIVNQQKAEKIRSGTDVKRAEDEDAEYEREREDISAQMNQVEMQQFSNPLGKLLGIAIKALTAKQLKKPKSRKDGQFDDHHDAVDVEAAVVAVGNGCIFKTNPKEAKKCLSDSGISDKDIKKIAESPTLIPAARRIIDRLEMQLPEGMMWQHTGKGLGEVALSETFTNAGASNTTPKTDLRACNKSGECMNFSMKMGPGQLMSGQKGETIGTIQVSMDRMRGCKGVKKGIGTSCNRKFSKKDAKLAKEMKSIMTRVDTSFVNLKLSPGMGISGWWLRKSIGGSKPKWWNTTGPGSLKPPVSWEDALGENPHDHPEWFPQSRKTDLDLLKKSDEEMDQIQDDLERIFNSGEFGKELKEHIMYEAMTGCGKFCGGCCGMEVCASCDSVHAATHLMVGNKDGTEGEIKEIPKPGSPEMAKMADKTNLQIRFKTGQPEKSSGAWIKELDSELFEKIKLPTKKQLDDGYTTPELDEKENDKLVELLNYTGQTFKGNWNDLSDKKKKELLTKAKVKLGGYSINSVISMGTSFASGGPIHSFRNESVQTFLEYNEHGQEKENTLSDAMKWIGDDPMKLADFLGYEPMIDSPHESYAGTLSDNSGSEHTSIKIDGKNKTIPIVKDDFEYKDYQQEWEDGKVDEPQEPEDKINEDFRLLTQPKINNPKVSNKLTIETFKSHTRNQENITTDSYEFNDSSTHGMGTFATKDINENDMIGLYYLNLLNENEDAPQFQRTDFCRFTNHSQHIPNIVLIKESDGNFYTYATREIQEGEELLVDYFDVYEQIMPSLGSYGEVIPEVLRWTEGYENMEIPPDGFGDLRDELAYFNEINECVDGLFEGAGDASASASETDANRAAYLKQYGAKPEQRKRRSARTNARNKLIRSGRASVGDGKDLDHKDGNPLNNSSKNLRMVNRSFNRGRDNNKWRKNTNEEHGAGEIGTKKLLKRYIKDTPCMSVKKGKK